MDKPKVKIHRWIITLAIILSLFGGSFLLYKWWKNQQINSEIQAKEQTLNQLQQQNQEREREQALQIYQTQQKQLSQVLTLARNPTIQEFFNDLLQGYAYRFAKQQNLTDCCLPLKFGGFYQKPSQLGQQQGEMGNCLYQQNKQQVIISLNQIFLFNKLGHERYLADPECYLMIDFTSLTETLAHELAHYFQFIKYEQSSCESSGAKDANGNFLDPELVKEHTQFTQEIKQMIVNSTEYPTLKKYWKAINVNI